jgi:hypothetical protein
MATMARMRWRANASTASEAESRIEGAAQNHNEMTPLAAQDLIILDSAGHKWSTRESTASPQRHRDTEKDKKTTLSLCVSPENSIAFAPVVSSLVNALKPCRENGGGQAPALRPTALEVALFSSSVVHRRWMNNSVVDESSSIPLLHSGQV